MKKFGWVSSYKLGKKPSSDCKYIFFSKEFLHYLIDEKENIYNHYNFERITGDAVMKSRKDGLLFVFPPLPPREHGISGGHGTSYDISAITYFKETIKNSIRFVLFALKILPRC